jgi:hypothetical protein
MAKIMHSWRTQLARWTFNACDASYALKQRDDTRIVPERSGTRRKETRIFAVWHMKSAATIGKRHQFHSQFRTNRHQPRLVEFGVANSNDSSFKIDIVQRQPQRLADA